MPSVVSLSKDGQVWVGQDACDRETQLGAYRNVKRIVGTGGKISPAVAKGVPYVAANSAGKTFKKDSLLNQIHDASEHPTLLRSSYSRDETISPEEISAHVLRTLKQAAQDATGKRVTRAVIGVPAYFHDAQREATKRAAELAGIDKVKLLREPEAAALAYGIGKDQIGLGDEDELVLVFDLGGGTFDVSILSVGGGVTEIISTSGNSQLGGSDLDGRVAGHIWKLLRNRDSVSKKTWPDDAKYAVVRAAEQIRIFLSNNKRVNLALPLKSDEWSRMETDIETILPMNYSEAGDLSEAGVSNETHVLCYLSRRGMEILCKNELQALLRPVREVAIMSGALLPGDANPAAVEAALEREDEYEKSFRDEGAFEDFYKDDEQESVSSVHDPDGADSAIDPNILLDLREMDIKVAKKAQQKGRKRARQVAKQELKYRQEKRKIISNEQTQADRVKIRDAISGRPISRVVLVGGATRMPAIGRLIAALTGVVPQRTVNPDEAVALGCAVHVGVLDGTEGMGKVLNPMQAAILKAFARQQGRSSDDFDDEEDFDEVVYD
jgi:molecular chaperone DnaK (HSP70)